MPISSLAPKKRTCLCALFGAGMVWLNVAQAGVPHQMHINSSSAAPLVATQSDASHATATLQTNRARHPVEDWQAVSAADLDNMRGGFATDAGLKVSVGIERAVYINGSLSTTTGFNIADVGKAVGGQPPPLNMTAGTVNLVQNGPSNTFQPASISQTATAIVVQNTLDSQNIKSMTIIDATSNSLGTLKSANFQSGLQDAMQNTLASR